MVYCWKKKKKEGKVRKMNKRRQDTGKKKLILKEALFDYLENKENRRQLNE